MHKLSNELNISVNIVESRVLLEILQQNRTAFRNCVKEINDINKTFDQIYSCISFIANNIPVVKVNPDKAGSIRNITSTSPIVHTS